MRLIFRKKFHKSYFKLSKQDQGAVDKALALFQADPHNKALRNHSLGGNRDRVRSIDARHDLRILFVEQDGYAVVFMIDVGTHSQLYG